MAYRPAIRGLVFGLVALALRAGEVVAPLLIATPLEPTTLETVNTVLMVGNLLATLIALVGVAYSAIAAHRREWGVVLVMAWIVSVVAAVLDINMFTYAIF